MKKIILIMAVLAAAAFADIKLDFIISVNKMGCSLKEWVENDYAHGQKWKYFGQFACAEEIHTPPRLVGLKLQYFAQNLKGEYIYTYGLD